MAKRSFSLANGLQVVLAQVPAAKTAACNILYGVGSRDEKPGKTGLAHLFEHLMFGGSQHVAHYDQEVQKVGGSNNAFTTFDITNYHIQLPVANLETALWVESDRMISGANNPQVLDIQRKVVIEEFKEMCLNKPYGDLLHHLLPQVYTQHPYQWPVVGQCVEHIQTISMQDVYAFAEHYYTPCNAVLCIAGNICIDTTATFVERWFADIPTTSASVHANRPQEPTQQTARHKVVEGNVPLDMLYKAYPMPGRTAQGYLLTKVLAYMLGEGDSSWLHQELVVRQKLLTSIEVHTLDTFDTGMLIIEAQPALPGTFSKVDAALEAMLLRAQECAPTEKTLQGIKNRYRTHHAQAYNSPLSYAEQLAFATWLDVPDLFEKEVTTLARITPEQVRGTAQQVLKPQKSNTIYYRATKPTP